MGNYAGKRLGPVNHQISDDMIVRQGLIASQLVKRWSEEHKTELRKYRSEIMELHKVSDGINDFIEYKKNLPLVQRMQIEQTANKRAAVANRLMKELVEDYRQTMMKAGVTTTLGYNFYDLRGPAYLIYPVNTPFFNSMPRWGKVNAGYGTMVNWKYTSTGPGNGTLSQQYAGAAEGKRVGTSLPNENNGVAEYSEFGVERSVSFTGEFAGEGYTDNVADEHLRGVHQIALQLESIIIGGNQGNGTNQNGFVLGTANTPSGTLASAIPANPTGSGLLTPSDGSTAGFSNATNVSCYVIELTMLGDPSNAQFGYQAAPTVSATGLVPSYSRTDAGPYADSDTINGGMGTLSAASTVVQAITSTPFVKFQLTPKAGAIAWAWFIDDQDATTPSTANAYLAAITNVPYCYFGANSKHTAISTNQAATATGLNSDHSAQALDTSGMFAWATQKGVWLNMSNLNGTDSSTGSTYNGLLQPTEVGTTKVPNIVQLDYDLRQQWNGYQTVGDQLWCSADVKSGLNNALGAGGFASGLRFQYDRDEQGDVIGGFVVSTYKSIYSMKSTGAEGLPIMLHPMMPVGTYMIRKTTNPYPQSRIPGVSGLFVQRDLYGIEWPIVKRQWEFGTYMHMCYGDYIPGLLTVRTGIQGVSTT